jgi:hypothetical protein
LISTFLDNSPYLQVLKMMTFSLQTFITHKNMLLPVEVLLVKPGENPIAVNKNNKILQTLHSKCLLSDHFHCKLYSYTRHSIQLAYSGHNCMHYTTI